VDPEDPKFIQSPNTEFLGGLKTSFLGAEFPRDTVLLSRSQVELKVVLEPVKKSINSLLISREIPPEASLGAPVNVVLIHLKDPIMETVEVVVKPNDNILNISTALTGLFIRELVVEIKYLKVIRRDGFSHTVGTLSDGKPDCRRP